MRRSALAALMLAWAGALPAAGAGYTRVVGPVAPAHQDFRWEAFRTYGTREGLPQSTVYALAQDTAGFIYAATEEGVARFDGRNWQRLPLPARDGVRPFGMRLAATSDGSLWIGTDVAGLWRQDAGGELHAVSGLPNGLAVEALLGNGADGAWVGTPRGVYRCRAEGCSEVAATRALQVAALLEGAGPLGPALWIGTNLDGLYRLDRPQSPAPVLAAWHLGKADGLPNDAVRALVQFAGPDDSDLWMGTGRGLARLSGNRLIAYDANNGFNAGSAVAFARGHDAQGQPVLRVGLTHGGIVEFHADGVPGFITRSEGLPEEAISSLLDTGDGRSLWVGTQSSGVTVRQANRWTALDERHGLPHRVIFGVGRAAFLDGVDTQWVGTVEGPARWVDGAWRRFLPPPYDRRLVFAMATEPGRNWFGTSHGLLEWTPKGLREFTVDNSDLPGVSVLDVLSLDGPHGREAWVGTRHGLARVRDGHVERVPIPVLGGAPVVRVLWTTGSGAQRRLWAATGAGIAWSSDGSAWTALPDGCLPSPAVMDVKLRRAADGREALWVASRGGVTRVAAGATTQCTQLDAALRPSGQIYQLAFDATERLYVFGSTGVTRYAFTDPYAAALSLRAHDQFGIADGLPGLEFNRASYVDASGRVWAGGVDGLALYDPRGELKPAPAAPLRLLSAMSRKDTPLVRNTEFAAGDDSLGVSLALLNYERAERHRYRAEMIGLDGGDTGWVSDNTFFFSRLPPGDYTLRLHGRDADGVEATPIELPFRILAPWWRTLPALVGFALALILIGILSGRWRGAALRRRAALLEREVAARTAELAEANARLEHASLTDPLTGLWNRRQFTQAAPRDCAAAKAAEASGGLTLLLLDCDHFKRINDHHGHAAGDAVLIELAVRLRRVLGPADRAIRWGGEEFLLVMHARDRAEVGDLAADVLTAIRGRPYPTPSGPIGVTCSIGAISYPFDLRAPDGHTLEQCLALADAALYRAKQGGRDRACVVHIDLTGAVHWQEHGLPRAPSPTTDTLA